MQERPGQGRSYTIFPSTMVLAEGQNLSILYFGLMPKKQNIIQVSTIETNCRQIFDVCWETSVRLHPQPAGAFLVVVHRLRRPKKISI